ncbi:MAG: XRE family transcriptional regulator [Erysipelotrichaceae bacterium]
MKNKTLGTMISSLRKESGMTQLELAEIFDISVDELMQIRKKSEDDERPDLKTLTDMIFKAIALAMGVGVIVLSILVELDDNSGLCMLGVSLALLVITSFRKN